jgi:hypothetical protein
MDAQIRDAAARLVVLVAVLAAGPSCGRQGVGPATPGADAARDVSPDAAGPAGDAGTSFDAPDTGGVGAVADASGGAETGDVLDARDALEVADASAELDARDGPEADAGSDGGRRPYRAIAVATGEIHTCALLDDHRVKCWGDGFYGQLGYGDTRDRGGSPTEMGDALPIVDLGVGRTATTIAAGRYATCAILDDGSMKCWGWAGLNGQFSKGDLGDEPGEMGDNLLPVDFGGRKAVHVAISEFAACASMDDDTIWCWGETPQMQVGLPSKKVKALSASDGDIVALYDDGTVSPALPGGTTPLLTSTHKVLAISGAFGGPTIALLDDDTVIRLSDMHLVTGAPNNTIALGVEFTGGFCALLSDGAVQCPEQSCRVPAYWCGNGPSVALGQPAIAITNDGSEFSCALLTDGGIKCWGGDPTLAPREWLGSEVAFTQPDGGTITYGSWHEVDLGSTRDATSRVNIVVGSRRRRGAP